MKKISIALLVVGLAGVGLGFGYAASSDAPQRCEKERADAVHYAEQATQAGEGTAEAQELMAKSQESSDWADGDCAQADKMRHEGWMMSAAGLVLAVIGLLVFRKARKALAP